MARPDDLRGYALKRQRGLVPHVYPAPHLRRGVVPPVTFAEAARYADAARRAARGKA